MCRVALLPMVTLSLSFRRFAHKVFSGVQQVGSSIVYRLKACSRNDGTTRVQSYLSCWDISRLLRALGGNYLLSSRNQSERGRRNLRSLRSNNHLQGFISISLDDLEALSGQLNGCANSSDGSCQWRVLALQSMEAGQRVPLRTRL